MSEAPHTVDPRTCRDVAQPRRRKSYYHDEFSRSIAAAHMKREFLAVASNVASLYRGAALSYEQGVVDCCRQLRRFVVEVRAIESRGGPRLLTSDRLLRFIECQVEDAKKISDGAWGRRRHRSSSQSDATSSSDESDIPQRRRRKRR